MALVAIEHRKGAVWLRLNRAERHNALVPELLTDLRGAIEAAAGEATTAKGPAALVLTGNGRSFSTGGDIAGFLAHAGSQQELVQYADQVVSTLHDAILDLLAFPAPVLCALNGPLTGGSTGLMLAADMVAMAQDAFIQPFYAEVGFGPDGGWTALLPERIGAAKALQIQYLNKRISSEQAVDLGLASASLPAAQIQAQIDHWVEEIAKRSANTHKATRAHVWDDARRGFVRQRLDQEKARFLDLIALPETIERMREFTSKRG